MRRPPRSRVSPLAAPLLWGLTLWAMGCAGDPGAGLSVDAGPDAPIGDAALADGSSDAGVTRARLGDPSLERWETLQSHLHTTAEHGCAESPLAPPGPCYAAAGILELL